MQKCQYYGDKSVKNIQVLTPIYSRGQVVPMRRDIVHIGAGQLRYEIREIVQTAHELNKLGREIIWGDIGDPVQKGEPMANWIKDIISSLVSGDYSYANTASAGDPETRKFLADGVNTRGGAQIGPDDILFFNGLGDAVSTLFTHLPRPTPPSPRQKHLTRGMNI